MKPLIQLKKAAPLLLITLACFGLSPASRAVSPPPDGGYPGLNTAEGTDALFSLTTGTGNTAIGFDALFNNTTGTNNTATGAVALNANTTGNQNTAIGFNALVSNTIASDNTATGFQALFSNTTGENNTATGDGTLQSNTIGSANTASGANALFRNTTGTNNTANGFDALNTACGDLALANNPAPTTSHWALMPATTLPLAATTSTSATKVLLPRPIRSESACREHRQKRLSRASAGLQ